MKRTLVLAVILAAAVFAQSAGATTQREAMMNVKKCLIAKETHFRYVGSRGHSGSASFMSNYGYGLAKWTYKLGPSGRVRAVTSYSFLDTREPYLPSATKAVVRRCVLASVS